VKLSEQLATIEQQARELLKAVPAAARIAAPVLVRRAEKLRADITVLRVAVEMAEVRSQEESVGGGQQQ
jgi:hypothetical protein